MHIFAESMKTPKDPEPKTKATFSKLGEQMYKFTVANNQLLTASPTPASGGATSS